MDDEKTNTENRTHDNTAEPVGPIRKPKIDIGDILIMFAAYVVPVIAWIGTCGVVGMFASDYTSRRAAILIGLLVGSVVIGMVVGSRGPEIEKSCCSVMWLFLIFLVLSHIRDFRHRTVQRQRNHTQPERKQNRSQREVTSTFLMACHRSEFL